MDGQVRVPSHVEDVTEVVLFANEPVAEDFEVAARELDEVDNDGAVWWRVRMGKCPDMLVVKERVRV